MTGSRDRPSSTQGLAAPAPTGSDAAAFQEVPSPGVRFLPNVARATNVPWIDSNGWRFAARAAQGELRKLPAGSAPLAAAEAFVFNVDAILNPDPKDVEDLGRCCGSSKANEQPPLPELVNIGVVDNPSPLMGEVLNLLTRRNLLYKVVPAPDRDARPDRAARYAGLSGGSGRQSRTSLPRASARSSATRSDSCACMARAR